MREEFAAPEGGHEAAASADPKPAPSYTSLLSNDDINSLLTSLTTGTEEADAPPPPKAPAPGEEVIEVGWKASEATEQVEEAPSEPAAPAAEPPAPPETLPAEAVADTGKPVMPMKTPVGEARAGDVKPARDSAGESAPEPMPFVETVAPKRGLLPHISLPVSASLAIGLFAASCFYLYFVTHPYRTVDAGLLRALRRSEPHLAIEVARGLIETGRYGDGLRELEPVFGAIGEGEQRLEAEFLKAEADYHLLPENAKIPTIRQLSATIDRLLEESPNHPRALEARRWRADLCRRSDMPEEAYEAYKQILTSSEKLPGLDAVLLDASKTALELGLPREAIESLRRLLQGYPESPLRKEAELALGVAYLDAGELEAGRMVLMNVGRSQADSELGARAFARLGALSYDAGDYDEAILLFETRLRTATQIEGNDRIYLLLARAHRAKGDNAEAERILRELVDFFPESQDIPAALVELSQLIEDLGRRDEAVEIARQAAQQYPDDPEVLRNAGRVLADAGDASAGAEALLAAERAGAEDPAVLLEAAHQWRLARDLGKAAEAYERIVNDYSASAESVQAAIELARLEVERGRVRAALERLEALAAEHKGGPAQRPVLDALATMYADLGLRERAAEVFAELAASTADSTTLARAALILLDAGQIDSAWAVASRIDAAALPGSLAYALLMKEGEVLSQTDPDAGFLQMEQAYRGYPSQRRSEDILRLLQAALALDRSASARAIVLDLERQAKANPADVPTLEKAAAAWGDHLYRRGDYLAAMDAYALAANAAGTEEADAPRSEENLWSRLQQANCLLRLEDLQASYPLFVEVAKAPWEWRELAQAKADYVRLELRRRGVALEPPGGEPRQEG